MRARLGAELRTCAIARAVIGVAAPPAATVPVVDAMGVAVSVGTFVGVSLGVAVVVSVGDAVAVGVSVAVADGDAVGVAVAEAVVVTVTDADGVSLGGGVMDGVGVTLGRAVGKINGACVGVGNRTMVGSSRIGAGVSSPPLAVAVGVCVDLAPYSNCLLMYSAPVPRQYSADVPRMAMNTSARRIRSGVQGVGISEGSVGCID